MDNDNMLNWKGVILITGLLIQRDAILKFLECSKNNVGPESHDSTVMTYSGDNLL
jgi:hypothetical protein